MRVLESGRHRRRGRCVPIVVALWATAASHAAGPGFSAILGGSGQDYASSVVSDAAGNTYVAGLTYSPDFRVTAGAFQTRLAGNGSLANPAAIASDAFVAKFGPDGKLLWSTFLGGSGDDFATGVGVDDAGNVVVAGWTRSFDFPVLHAAQTSMNNGVSPYRWDAFVTKLDPTGAKLIYSTYLGGPDDDGAYGLALDAAGNAYVAGPTQVAAGFTGFKSSATGFGIFVSKLDTQGALVYSFFHPYGSFAGIATAGIAVDAAGSAYVTGTASMYYPAGATRTFGPPGSTQAMVFKISPDGSQKIYETTLGGSVDTNGLAIAVDRTGAAYVAGDTTSVDFPLVRPLQSTFGARSLWKSNDGGATWTPRSDLPFAFLQATVVDPSAFNILYAATTDGGVFKSVDAGVTWSKVSHGIPAQVQSLVIDPLHSQTLYAASASAIYKTVDGGGNWSMVDSTTNSGAMRLAIDAQSPNNIYWTGTGPARKSSDGGATWSNLPFPGTSIQLLALDPRVSGSIYAYSTAIILKPPQGSTPSFIYHSTDGGATWTKLTSPSPASPGWTIDGSTNPSTVYNGLSWRSTDNGATWTPLPVSPATGPNTSAVAVDSAGTLYTAVYQSGLFVSHDRGQSWTAIGSPVPQPDSNGFTVNVTGIVPVGATGTLYTVLQNQQNSGFVTKLSPDGSNIAFSTLLNGHVSFGPVITYAAQPGVFLTQNWISAIALDPSGNIVVAGGTRASDFPVANPAHAANAGRADAFVATIAADGSRLLYSTYLGGSQDDAALAVATDPQGNLILAGQTWSSDFPVPGGVQLPTGLGEAFVVKSTPPPPPAVASVLNAASYQPGIAAGSWVMIKGSNLANTTRTWVNSDFVNGNLPVALDGVSVTIDGKPASVYYISPTQINVLAPSDNAIGAVSVVVNNNGATSLPATAQLQAVAPAFFTYQGTAYALASRLPDYAPVGYPSMPAKPGDTVVLWGTGFGETAPALAVAIPTVTVGGLPAQLVGLYTTSGSAGLNQLTIQLPAGLPSGAALVQASIGGVPTQAGITVFVEKP
jgi:uncharacterized protein (TIGR03437 family)